MREVKSQVSPFFCCVIFHPNYKDSTQRVLRSLQNTRQGPEFDDDKLVKSSEPKQTLHVLHFSFQPLELDSNLRKRSEVLELCTWIYTICAGTFEWPCVRTHGCLPAHNRDLLNINDIWLLVS